LKPLPKKLAIVLVTGGGTGYLKPFPGTWGSALAVLLMALLGPWPLSLHLLLCLVVFLLGVWACNSTRQVFDSVDAPQIIVDEIVGMMITMVGIPMTFKWLVVGFFAFRFFDIVKPWPICWIDTKWKNDWGIMLDDVLAGLFACLVLQLIWRSQI